MNERIAKPVVKNKFWIVEDHGEKIATIQAVEDGSFVYVHNDGREHFPSVRVLSKKYNIKFSAAKQSKAKVDQTVYGYPTEGRAYNQVFDVQRQLPVYTKTPKSRSCFCAGHYLVNTNGNWNVQFCPKNITLNRYEYLGPFKTEQEAKNAKS
jgi:hypothetical protein